MQEIKGNTVNTFYIPFGHTPKHEQFLFIVLATLHNHSIEKSHSLLKFCIKLDVRSGERQYRHI